MFQRKHCHWEGDEQKPQDEKKIKKYFQSWSKVSNVCHRMGLDEDFFFSLSHLNALDSRVIS